MGPGRHFAYALQWFAMGAVLAGLLVWNFRNEDRNSERPTTHERTPAVLLIAVVFFGPLLFAAWMYYSGDALRPQSRSNHGVLLEPIVNLWTPSRVRRS